MVGDDQRGSLEPIQFVSGGVMPASALPVRASSLELESEPDLPAQIAEPEPFDDYEAEDLVAAEFYD